MSTEHYNGLFFHAGQFSAVEDVLAVEVALSISVNKVPFTVTMQTPGHEFDLVRGLLHAENVYRDLLVHPKIQVVGFDKGGHINAVDVTADSNLILKDFAGTRNVVSASSCGICGKTSLDELDNPAIINHSLLHPTTVEKMFEEVSTQQQSFQKSGGTHAAGIFTIDGQMLVMREDIGRHNAVDKAIGSLILSGQLDKAKCMTVSGRVSYEIIGKAKAAGIPFVAAVSAPSSLAVDDAQASGITLMAFCRNNKLTVYSNSQQIGDHHEGMSTGKVTHTHVEEHQ